MSDSLMDTDTADVFWAMLMDLESHTRPEDVLRKMLVESAYRHWNNMHPNAKPMHPRWHKEDEEIGHGRKRR